MDDTVHLQKIHKNIRFVDVGEISKIPDVRNFGNFADIYEPDIFMYFLKMNGIVHFAGQELPKSAILKNPA